MAMKNVNVRIDEDVKSQAEQIFSEIGISFATALNVFLRKTVSCGGFPFELKVDIPNQETKFSDFEDREEDKTCRILSKLAMKILKIL